MEAVQIRLLFQKKSLKLAMIVMTAILCMLPSFPQRIHATGTTYYVSSSGGNDSNDGLSSATPWRTLTKISSITFNPGDTILLKAGDQWTGEILYPHGEGTSTNWITVSSYGTGAKPKLLPGASTNWAIYINKYGGWKFVGLEIGNARNGIVYMNDDTSSAQRDGLWIEDCSFHDLKDGPVYPAPLLLPFLNYSQAIMILNNEGVPLLKNVTIKDSDFLNNDSPFWIDFVENLTVDNVETKNSLIMGPVLYGVENGVVQNSRFLNNSITKGMYWGTAGFTLRHCVNVVVQDSEIAFTYRPNGQPDGVGFDFEGGNVNSSAVRLNIHDNAGSAFLIYNNSGETNPGTSILDITATNNGTQDPVNLPAFIRSYGNPNNAGTISGNTVTKIHSAQRLNYVNGIGLTETWPAGYAVSNNSMYVSSPAGIVGNPGFESGVANPWTGSGTANVTASNVHSGSYAAQVGGAGSAFEQAIAVSPNTTYAMSGFAKVAASGEQVSIGVKNHGGAQQAVPLSSTSYAKGSLTFTTGPTNTTATIFLSKDSGTGNAFGDDFSVVPLSTNHIGLDTPGSHTEVVANNYFVATKATAGANMDVTKLQLYVLSGATGNVKMGIYSDNAGSPGAKLAETTAITLANGWNTGLIPTTSLTSGTSYWLVYDLSSKGSVITYNPSSYELKYAPYAYSSALPSSAPTSMIYGGGTYAFYAS
ncbi:carbohydrate binding domain-containing protein [Cohnella herbarum]|uniref:CBM-cenC domain-containing protein n=1 Tax=Cohnella herbarum TaxID=2728023 RepID=A0A7Z2VNE4_9BACL|nr:carbohydrate binding domain-containing protein [Cohnella herbarum]QJD86274.1 hypothetical protein HH215_25975 [Cohnella herbarum]